MSHHRPIDATSHNSKASEIMAPETLAPEHYPWEPIHTEGVLVQGAFTPSTDTDRTLREHGGSPLADRHRVIAVGSNASPAVMDRKMRRAGIDRPLAMTFERHAGIAVGHSAHVSLPGYIATAPYRCSHCVHRFVTVHLDDEQVAALDATEPNYDRIAHDGAWLYASRWQVIAVRGTPITARTQAELHRALGAADSVWHDRFGGRPEDEVAAQLAHDGSIGEWRHRWRSIGLTRDAGFAVRPI